LETQLILSKELGYVDEMLLRDLLTECDGLGKRLRSLANSLRTRVNSFKKG